MGLILFFEKIEIKSLLIMSKCSSVFFKASVSFKVSSFNKFCFDLSRLSIKFKASLAKENPPYSKASSSVSYTHLTLPTKQMV